MMRIKVRIIETINRRKSSRETSIMKRLADAGYAPEAMMTMSYQVLSTKLYIPPIQLTLVQRPRLVQHLESGYQSGQRVTLVSAPASFGKTTIIREWITASEPGKPFGWLSLDDGDNDPVRFLIYLVSAIQKVNAEIGQTILASLKSSQIPPLLDLVETLINEISFEGESFLIVLDDYHLIKKTEVHSILQLLLKRQPDTLHLVIISRKTPPFSLPRMRVRGRSRKFVSGTCALPYRRRRRSWIEPWGWIFLLRISANWKSVRKAGQQGCS